MLTDFFLKGVKNADENELRSIATDPDEIHMYNVADFSFLLDIVDNVADNLCNSVKGGGMWKQQQAEQWKARKASSQMLIITWSYTESAPTAPFPDIWFEVV